MRNHRHFVLWPELDDELASFLQRLTATHVTYWQKHRTKVGERHLLQGHFKLFPVETDDWFYQVVRYVERNALRAGWWQRAEDWHLGSAWRQLLGTVEERRMLINWPLPRPCQSIEHLNRPQGQAEVNAIRQLSGSRATAGFLSVDETDHPSPGARVDPAASRSASEKITEPTRGNARAQINRMDFRHMGESLIGSLPPPSRSHATCPDGNHLRHRDGIW